MSSRSISTLRKSPLLVAAVALVLLLAGSAFAASGVGTLVTGGEDGAATAHSAQAPVGSVSATPSVAPPNSGVGSATPPNSRVGSDVTSNNPPVQDADLTSTNKAGVKTATARGTAAGNGASATSQLPFTGFLAIPVLLAGAAMLLIGIALRRRRPQPA